MARTTRVPNAFAGPGAVRQEGSLPIYECNACGRQVVWATSSKSGRKYLVDVSKGHLDQRYYNKRNAHDCAKVLERRAAEEAAMEEFLERQRRGHEFADRMLDARRRLDAGELTEEEFLALIDG